jgi:DNA replication protein DnaC
MDSVRAYLGGEGLMREHGVEPTKTLDNFRITGKCAGAREAFEAARDFAEGEANYVNLLIYGGVGCGKTHLCNAVARRMHERGVETRLYTVADLLSLLRVAIGRGDAEEDINRLKECKCLILDDFKPEDDSLWALARLEEIIDFRYRCSRLMMVTTNRNLSELPERIASRFSDVDCGRVVLNEAPDYRRRLK